jgi:hypothetical protein
MKMERNGEKKEKHFLFPIQEIGVRTQNGGPRLSVLHFQSWGIHEVIKIFNLGG